MSAESPSVAGTVSDWVQEFIEPDLTYWQRRTIEAVYGLPAEPVPDPIEQQAQAAIEARRTRNTGPASRSRAPKNIGWGRGRP